MTLKNLLLIILLTLCFSCGTSDEEKVEDAIFHARQLLTGGRCAEALEILGTIPAQPRNVDYLKTSASAYACLGGYSTVEFFATDLSKIGATQTAFLGSLATFSTSDMTQDPSAAYLQLKTATSVLLLGGGITESSFNARSGVLGTVENNNLSVFAIYMIMVELGRFMNYYGNAVDSTGVKGGGAQANGCYMDYTDADAIAGIALDGTDSCDTTNEGHPTITGNRERACDGIVLFNNFIDIITNVTFSGSNVGSLGSLASSVTSACTAGAIFNAETCATKTFTGCVEDTTNIDAVQIERYYGIIFENMHL